MLANLYMYIPNVCPKEKVIYVLKLNKGVVLGQVARYGWNRGSIEQPRFGCFSFMGLK